MGDHKEEQQEEIEALESIYPDSFTVLSTTPHCFSISVATEEGMYEECDPISVTLQFTYTPDYPDEPPLFEVISSEGLPDDNSEDKLIGVIQEQIDENLGMVMIFTLVSAVQEFLNLTKDEIIKRKEEEEERKEREIKEAEMRKCHGTPVSIETFLTWKRAFDAELVEAELRLLQIEKKNKKLTGKEVFQQMKTDDGELLDGEVEAVEVDESLFEDDFDIDEELDVS